MCNSLTSDMMIARVTLSVDSRINCGHSYFTRQSVISFNIMAFVKVEF